MNFKILVIFLGIFLWVTFVSFYFKSKDFLTINIENKVSIKAELADTNIKRTKGLSNKEKLAENQGMLFVFEKPGFYSFWMKEMKFPIDILWIDSEQKVIDLTENLSPETFPQIFQPLKPVQYVLEVNAGFIKKYNIKIGDKIKIIKK